MKFSYTRWTDHPHFMVDVQNVHDLQLTYGTYMSNGRNTECSHFTVDDTFLSKTPIAPCYCQMMG